MPLNKGYSKKTINKNIEKLIREGYKPDTGKALRTKGPNQAVAIAYAESKKYKKRK